MGVLKRQEYLNDVQQTRESKIQVWQPLLLG